MSDYEKEHDEAGTVLMFTDQHVGAPDEEGRCRMEKGRVGSSRVRVSHNGDVCVTVRLDGAARGFIWFDAEQFEAIVQARKETVL